ncbi:MAG: S8 family serine peptidase, partial [Candidatus Sulfomarinibacteraceae bacterium]
DAMMAWAAGSGAHLSSNSWGLIGQTGPEVGYSAAAVQADAAVRDADPAAPGSQPLAVFFSAGNTGPGPGTVTSPGTAKNVITVGAVENDRCGAWVPGRQSGPDVNLVLTSSGRGPSQARLKPDLVAHGSDVLSPESGDSYAVQIWDQGWTGTDLALNTGTSQACALAAGAGAVLHETMWRTRGRRPSPALLKAALVAGADAGPDGADFDRGWGRLDLESAARGLTGGTGLYLDQDETAELTTGETFSSTFVVESPDFPLGLALVWTDPPGEADAQHPLVNDLDLTLTAPSGTVYRGNVFSGAWSVPDPGAERDSDNNVEVVRVDGPEPGPWVVRVVAVDVSQIPAGLSGQDFAVAVAGDVAPCAAPPPPPAVVGAEDLGANRIRVEWSEVSGATRYEVSRSDVPGGRPYVPIATVPAGVGSYLDTDVSGGSEVHYVVRAYRSCWSAYSDEASATSTGECLLTPVFAGLAAVEDQASAGCSLELSWVPAEIRCPGPVLYSVYRGDHAGFAVGEDSRLADGLSGTAWRDELLEPGREYFYVVRARQSGQPSDDGNTVEIRAKPSGPSDVSLDDGAEGGLDGWVREPGSSADGGTEPWGVTDDDAWVGASAFFVADEDRVKDQVLVTAQPIGLPAGTAPVLEFMHRYRLHRGRDGGRFEYSTNGGRDWHDILSGDGQTVPDDPGRWQTGGYTDTIGAPSNPLFLSDGWTGDSRGWLRSRVDLEDFAGRRLLLRWRMACDDSPGSGWGWWLDGIRLAVEHECLPCSVSSPAVNLVARAHPDGVELEWDEQSIGHHYRIRRSDSPDGPFRDLGPIIGAPISSTVDSTASGGSDYTYAIAVRHNGCWTDASAGVTATAGGPCKLAPLFWGLDEVVDRREPGCALDLEWRPGAPGCAGAGVSYRVYRSSTVDPGSETLIADNLSGPRFRDLSIIDSASYNYRVRAVDGVSLAEDTNPVIHSGWTTGPQEVHFSDSVEGPLDEWWTGLGSGQDTGTQPWEVVDDNAHSGGRSWFCRNEPQVKDQVVGLVDGFEITDDSTVLGFHHFFDLEPFWDGGRLEYSTDGGSTWQDILRGDGATVADNGSRLVRGGYTGFVSVGTGHPFGGEPAWTGFHDRWIESVVDLADFVGLTVHFRWRLGCDRSDARVGWWLDDVELRTTSSCQTIELPPPRSSQGRVP